MADPQTISPSQGPAKDVVEESAPAGVSRAVDAARSHVTLVEIAERIDYLLGTIPDIRRGLVDLATDLRKHHTLPAEAGAAPPPDECNHDFKDYVVCCKCGMTAAATGDCHHCNEPDSRRNGRCWWCLRVVEVPAKVGAVTPPAETPKGDDDIERRPCHACEGERFDGFICEKCGRHHYVADDGSWWSEWPNDKTDPASAVPGETQAAIAERIARAAHAGQMGKWQDAGRPYIEHVERVVAQVQTDDEKAVAWLHDVLEDTPVTAADLSKSPLFEHVCCAVTSLKRRNNQPYTEYIAGVCDHGGFIARAVKIADLRDHLRPGCPEAKRPQYEYALAQLLAWHVDVPTCPVVIGEGDGAWIATSGLEAPTVPQEQVKAIQSALMKGRHDAALREAHGLPPDGARYLGPLSDPASAVPEGAQEPQGLATCAWCAWKRVYVVGSGEEAAFDEMTAHARACLSHPAHIRILQLQKQHAETEVALRAEIAGLEERHARMCAGHTRKDEEIARLNAEIERLTAEVARIRDMSNTNAATAVEAVEELTALRASVEQVTSKWQTAIDAYERETPGGPISLSPDEAGTLTMCIDELVAALSGSAGTPAESPR